MILTVTPNATVDKTYRVEDFRLDVVNRPSAAFQVAGGKGVNVARVYQTLGGKAIATGFLGGLNGRIVARALKTENIENRCVRIRSETRVCIAVIDPQTGTQTEINERGGAVTAREVNELFAMVTRLLREERFEFVVLSGSLPPDAPETLYAGLIEIARQEGVPAVLDTSGAALREGVRARPWLVKPNRTELETLLSRPLPTFETALDAAKTLCAEGVGMVALTRGAEGALLLTPQGGWEAIPPPITFASAVASGDSFVAAFLWGWEFGQPAHDPAVALRWATGAGAANAAVVGAGFCTRDAIAALAQQADVRRL